MSRSCRTKCCSQSRRLPARRKEHSTSSTILAQRQHDPFRPTAYAQGLPAENRSVGGSIPPLGTIPPALGIFQRVPADTPVFRTGPPTYALDLRHLAAGPAPPRRPGPLGRGRRRAGARPAGRAWSCRGRAGPADHPHSRPARPRRAAGLAGAAAPARRRRTGPADRPGRRSSPSAANSQRRWARPGRTAPSPSSRWISMASPPSATRWGRRAAMRCCARPPRVWPPPPAPTTSSPAPVRPNSASCNAAAPSRRPPHASPAAWCGSCRAPMRWMAGR